MGLGRPAATKPMLIAEVADSRLRMAANCLAVGAVVGVAWAEGPVPERRHQKVLRERGYHLHRQVLPTGRA